VSGFVGRVGKVDGADREFFDILAVCREKTATKWYSISDEVKVK
jgi:hypothetical protein